MAKYKQGKTMGSNTTHSTTGTPLARVTDNSLSNKIVGYATRCFIVDSLEDFIANGITPLRHEHHPPHYHVWVMCRKILTKQHGSALYTMYATMDDARLYSKQNI